jgi:hypothetical protein
MPRNRCPRRCHRPCHGCRVSKQWTADNAKVPSSAPSPLPLLCKQAREGRPTMPIHCHPCHHHRHCCCMSKWTMANYAKAPLSTPLLLLLSLCNQAMDCWPCQGIAIRTATAAIVTQASIGGMANIVKALLSVSKLSCSHL